MGNNEGRYEMMFKHYSTLTSYREAFERLIEKAIDYRS